MTFDLTNLITALMGLLMTIITSFLVPLLKAKLGEVKYHKTMELILNLVKAAEQMFGSGSGEKKLQWVRRQLEMRGIVYDQAEVEAAVYKLGEAFYAIDEGVLGVETTTEVEIGTND